MCRPHLRAMCIKNKAMRAARKAAKMCIYCNERPAWWTVYCVICREEQHHPQDPLPDGARKALAKYRRSEAIDARREQAQLAVDWTDDPRIAKIFSMRHGLEDGTDRTLEEIGAEFDVTRERVRQVEALHLNWLEGEGFDVAELRAPFKFTERKPHSARRHLTSDEQRKKATCHRLVQEALASGELIKGLCSVCQAVDVVGHHRDYDKPLEVEWLCREHHMDEHRGFWLDKITKASALLDGLRKFRPRLKDVSKATGISTTTIRKILNGVSSVRPKHVDALAAYVKDH